MFLKSRRLTGKVKNLGWTGHKGGLLLELNLVILVFLLAVSIFNQRVQGAFKTLGKIRADLQLSQADRYTDSFLGKQISFESREVILGDDWQGGSKIICRDVSGNQQVSFYVQGQVLYRRILSGTAVGVNPLSLPQVAVAEFAVRQLSPQVLWVSYKLSEKQTERQKVFQHFYYLGNGVLTDVRSDKTIF